MRDAGGDQGARRLFAARHAQAARTGVGRVDEGAVALLGPEQLVRNRLVDDAGDDLALALQADRDGEVGHTVQKVCRAVERVDDPSVATVALGFAAFLAEETVLRPRAGQFGAQRALGLDVGMADEVAGALSETCNCSTSPKSRFRFLAAAKAARIITVMVAKRTAKERRSGGPSARGPAPWVHVRRGLPGATRAMDWGDDRWGRPLRSILRTFHVAAILGVDHQPRADADMRRHHTRTPPSTMAGL